MRKWYATLRRSATRLVASAALLTLAAPVAAQDWIKIEDLAAEPIRIYDGDGADVGAIGRADVQFPQGYAPGDENGYGFLPLVLRNDQRVFVDPFDVTVSTEPFDCPTGSTVHGKGVASTAGSGSLICVE